jgi:hypothetical protein
MHPLTVLLRSPHVNFFRHDASVVGFFRHGRGLLAVGGALRPPEHRATGAAKVHRMVPVSPLAPLFHVCSRVGCANFGTTRHLSKSIWYQLLSPFRKRPEMVEINSQWLDLR